MDSPDWPPALPPSPPPDLVTRLHRTRLVVTIIAATISLLTIPCAIGKWQANAAAPSRLSLTAAVVQTVGAVVLTIFALCLAALNQTARRWASGMLLFFGTVRGMQAVANFLSVLILMAGGGHPLTGPHSTVAGLITVLGFSIQSIGDLWVGSYLRLGTTIFLFHNVGRPANDDAYRDALVRAPDFVGEYLRMDSLLAIARRGVRRYLIWALAVFFLVVTPLAYRQEDRRVHPRPAAGETSVKEKAFSAVRAGNPIVHGLSMYYDLHIKYPQTLSELDEEGRRASSEVPSGTTGGWDYSPILEGRDYQLSIELSPDPTAHPTGSRSVLCYRSDDRYGETAFGGKLVDRIGKWALYAN